MAVASPITIATGAEIAAATASPEAAEGRGRRGPSLADEHQRGLLCSDHIDDPVGERPVHQQRRVGVDSDREAGGAQLLPARWRRARPGAHASRPRTTPLSGAAMRARDLESELGLAGVLQRDQDPLAEALAGFVRYGPRRP